MRHPTRTQINFRKWKGGGEFGILFGYTHAQIGRLCGNRMVKDVKIYVLAFRGKFKTKILSVNKFVDARESCFSKPNLP